MPFADPEKKREYQREYQREYHKKWYEKNKSKHRAWDKAIRERLSAKLAAYKLKRGCMDCGYKKCAAALDFDHVRGTKVCDVGGMVGRRLSWERILAEIEKCDLVCANCHRERTEARRMPG